MDKYEIIDALKALAASAEAQSLTAAKALNETEAFYQTGKRVGYIKSIELIKTLPD